MDGPYEILFSSVARNKSEIYHGSARCGFAFVETAVVRAEGP